MERWILELVALLALKYYQAFFSASCSSTIATVTALLVGSDIDPGLTSKSRASTNDDFRQHH